MQTAQSVVADLPVKATKGDRGRSRVGEQRPHRSQLTIGLSQSTQRFHTRDTARGGIDKWLKAGERLPVDHEASLVRSCFWIDLYAG
jgi:hypothetical protein